MIKTIAIIIITLASFTLASKEKVDVIEFFYFGCPHCQKIEPELKDWVNKNKENINFEKIPVDFGGLTKKAAEHYYISMYLEMDENLNKTCNRYVYVNVSLSRKDNILVSSILPKKELENFKFLP